MAALWYKRRHRYVDNQRVKLKIVFPTTCTAMAKFAIDTAILESIFILEINREIFIPNREVGRFSLLRKTIGRSNAKSGCLEALPLARTRPC